jgi:predicted metal-dependent phosphoesterase TrpH
VLLAHGYARTMQDAFEQYLIPCNVPKSYFPMAEAIAEIHRTGGVAVLAHPHAISDDRRTLEALVAELVPLGLDGIEAYNNLCDEEGMAHLHHLARQHGLLVTGGSDFHGGSDGIEIGKVRGSVTVPASLLPPLADRARRTASPP